MTDYRTDIRPDPRDATHPGVSGHPGASGNNVFVAPPAERSGWGIALIVVAVFAVIAVLAAVFLADDRTVSDPAAPAVTEVQPAEPPAPAPVPADPVTPPVTATEPAPASPPAQNGVAPVAPAPVN